MILWAAVPGFDLLPDILSRLMSLNEQHHE